MLGPMKHDLATQMLPVSELVPWSRNPRRNDAAAERLAYTIQTHGWTTPVLVQAGTRRIIGGHTRLKAALKLGLTEVPCVLLDVDDRQADAIAIADNRLGELAEWDADELGALLRELDDAGADMAAVGYADAEMAELLAALASPSDDEWGDALGGLPEGDRAPIQTMTFTLHDDQVEVVTAAIAASKGLGDFADTGNENSNGNALARVCELWLGVQRG